MKFLHLSDLHIGKTVNGFSMLEEQRHVFAQIIGYIKTEKPSAVLIAGDIYDRAVPGIEAVRLFDDFLTDLAGTGVVVLIISGNHDSPERLHYASRLLSEQKLHLCGVFDGRLQSVQLKDDYGEINFWLLPFIKPSAVRAYFAIQDMESYADAIMAVIDSAAIDYTKRNVLLSHQFYVAAGVTPIRSESEINPVGGLDAAPAAIVSGFDYVALGHLHGRQNVGPHIRYAGSPVKYSLSEWRHTKTVTLVSLGEKGNLEITELPLMPLHNMREIKGPLALLTSQEIADGDCEDYLRVILTDEEEIVDPMGKLRSRYPNVMALDFENSRTSIEITPAPQGTGQLEKLSTYDLFSEFYLATTGAVMSQAQAGIVRELLEGGRE
ncbi:MAG TPA: exonuclease sbcCD subunit D [Clostridiales bacterium]|nr:exonuclease sbcCD subunit D [Clostridiales bacterium]